MSMQPSAPQSYSRKTTANKRSTFLFFFVTWLFLIGTGVLGTIAYTHQMKEKLKAELYTQTEVQLKQIEHNYQTQLTELKTGVTQDMKDLQGKVDSFNELLTFTKDQASSKTDNSNKLYTQLNEVKKKLDELKKQLDVLK